MEGKEEHNSQSEGSSSSEASRATPKRNRRKRKGQQKVCKKRCTYIVTFTENRNRGKLKSLLTQKKNPAGYPSGGGARVLRGHPPRDALPAPGRPRSSSRRRREEETRRPPPAATLPLASVRSRREHGPAAAAAASSSSSATELGGDRDDVGPPAAPDAAPPAPQEEEEIQTEGTRPCCLLSTVSFLFVFFFFFQKISQKALDRFKLGRNSFRPACFGPYSSARYFFTKKLSLTKLKCFFFSYSPQTNQQ